MLRNQKGFTLIEIIAVLVILGVLAAVAVPRYLDLAAEAKRSAALAEIAEMKGTLNLAYARLFIRNGTQPSTGAAVVTEAGVGTTVGVAPDIWTVTLTAGTTNVAVTVVNRNNDAAYNATGTWNLPL